MCPVITPICNYYIRQCLVLGHFSVINTLDKCKHDQNSKNIIGLILLLLQRVLPVASSKLPKKLSGVQHMTRQALYSGQSVLTGSSCAPDSTDIVFDDDNIWSWAAILDLVSSLLINGDRQVLTGSHLPG